MSATKSTRIGHRLAYHIYTIWLFTFSDLKTIVLPSTFFAIFNALAAKAYGITFPELSSHPITITFRASLTCFWVWINLLPFAIDNQRTTSAIAEDAVNKSWRPMPSRRLTQPQAKNLMLWLYPCAIFTSIFLGGIKQSILLIVLGYWYNDLGGADSNSVTRNFINACGFLCFTSGAMEVALASHLPITPDLAWWLLMTGLVILTTVQTQDFSDQKGDKLRHRMTLPLEIGDHRARLITSMITVVWSFICTWYWLDSMLRAFPVISIGLTIACRLLAVQGEAEDHLTFIFWNLWMVLIHTLPFLSITNGAMFNGA